MKRSMKYKAVIFDFDGVIGRTMEDNYRAWCRAFSCYDVLLDKEEYFLLEGMNAEGVARIILERNGVDTVIPASVASLKEKFYSEDHSFSFYTGARELVESLQGCFSLGLVSGASSRRLRETVPNDFLERFDIVITGDTVRNPKPDPEPYLMASDALSIASEECLAVENAPFGIESAKKSGMDCVAICSTLDRKHLQLADFILDDIEMLCSFFNTIKN